MRILLMLLAATCVAIPASRAIAQCDESGLGALGSAKQARAIVSDLELMKSWYATVGQQMNEDFRRYGTPLDAEAMPFDYGVSWMWWTDTFDDVVPCRVEGTEPIDLDRSWWGAYARVDDHELGLGYELFYLSASDGLSFGAAYEDFEYNWDQRIAGASLWYRGWIRASAGTIDVAAPSRSGEPVHDGSIYLNLGVPRFGLGADVVTHPGSRRLDSAILSMRKRPLPWVGLEASALAGFLEDEGRAIVGVGLSGLSDALSVQLLFEGVPVRLRSAVMRIETEYSKKTGTDIWARVGFAPYLEVSAFNGSAFEQLTGRRLVPGAATGARAFVLFGWTQIGIDGFVGLNRAAEIDRIPEIADRVQWGARLYLRAGL